MSQQEATGLKPCPFCGGAGEREDDEVEQDTSVPEFAWIQCRRCGATGPRIHLSDDGTPEDAWNRRTSP